MKKKSGTNAKNKLILFIFLMCLLVVGGLVVYYQYMRKQQMQGMEKVPTTEAEKLIAKDMEVGYPETPTELLKLWGRINQCIYNTDLNDEEQEALFRQLRMMYSSELLEQNEEPLKSGGTIFCCVSPLPAAGRWTSSKLPRSLFWIRLST